jgi:ribonuclease J
VLPRLPAPLYASRFTSLLIRNKLAEFPAIDVPLHVFADREKIKLGDMVVDPLAVTHSIPDSVALAIDTPGGIVLHTGDFKIDPDPIDGRRTDIEGLRAYGERGVSILLSDSTNAEKPGHTWGEREVGASICKIVEAAPHRVVLTTFASHIDRAQAVLDAAAHCGRKVVLAGRSMANNVRMALEHGFLRGSPDLLAEPEDWKRLRRDEVILLASGSQGEPGSAMTRIAANRMSPIKLDPGDQVILSSRRIPGNERAIGRMVNSLYRLGCEIITDHDARVHSSGHGFNDEQRLMLELCRPRFFVPVHGELRHMTRHAALARACGVAQDHALITEDGKPLALRSVDGELLLQRDEPVQAGVVFVDGKGIGDVGEIVLRDRRILSESGIIVCAVVFAGDGALVAGPELATRGLVYVDESLELLARAADDVKKAVLALDPASDVPERADAVRIALRRFFRRELERRPLVVPIVICLPNCCCE